MSHTTIVWLRLDLRLADHGALSWAAARGSVVPVFIWSPREEGAWKPGGASRWWLHHSLCSLSNALVARGSRLIVRHGPVASVLAEIAEQVGADTVVWSERYEPHLAQQEGSVASDLTARGLAHRRFEGCLLRRPDAVVTATGGPYRVFTPYSKAVFAAGEPDAPLPAPGTLRAPASWPESLEIDALSLLPRIPWDQGLRESWLPGETGAHAALGAFLDRAIARYGIDRDVPSIVGVSRLSPHLHFGEISPRQVWHAVRERQHFAGKPTEPEAHAYLRQLLWREFGHHLLFHYPSTPDNPFHEEFGAFPWRSDTETLRIWQRGETGYPMVDAGMRELWLTGSMHNRARMIVASFLTKHLLLAWQEGARWFWDTLVDADLANNTLGWQWSAGCGADAAPYFRVFNPIIQGQRFDPEGAYVKRFLPELERLPASFIHKPWEAPPLVLAEAGITLGRDYPHPIVEHGLARERALAAYAELRSR